jgi:hypothetical protein
LDSQGSVIGRHGRKTFLEKLKELNISETFDNLSEGNLNEEEMKVLGWKGKTIELLEVNSPIIS